MFKDDPVAVHYDKHGVYCDKKTLTSHIGIGENITWERAQEVYRADINKQSGMKRRFVEGYKGYKEYSDEL